MVNTILVMVVVPMLVAGMLASEWVSSNFEERLQRWIEDSSPAGQTWLRAYQNDAVMLGRVLADDPDFVSALDRGGHMGTMKQPVERIAKELNVSIMQVYTAQQILLYTSMPIRMNVLWEPGQTQAVMKVVRRTRTCSRPSASRRYPRQGKPRYYLVLGGLLNNDFIDELNQLTGLTSRLYYREGARFFDVFTTPGKVTELKELSKEAMQRMVKNKKPFYSQHAEGNRFRGVYTPVVDSVGRVEAILFSGLERRGVARTADQPPAAIRFHYPAGRGDQCSGWHFPFPAGGAAGGVVAQWRDAALHAELQRRGAGDQRRRGR